MKESILKRLNKMDDGGVKKAASLFMKGAKPFIKGAANRLTGPLGLLLGSQKLNADNSVMYEPLDIEMPSGKRSTDMIGNPIVKVGDKMSKAELDAISKSLVIPTTTMEMGGAKALPGGMVAPIPGTDAVEFMGQTHEEGGIMMDPQTEVEDGETMDKVTMKRGGKRDYFFSSHLKKGGRSYADMHKDVLAMGGTQEDVDMLARMQEKSAGRDPNQVAKLGGVVEYEAGGLSQADKMKNFQKILQMDPSYSRLLDYQMLQQEGQVPMLSAEELPTIYGDGLIGPETKFSSIQDKDALYFANTENLAQSGQMPEMKKGFNLREKANLFAGSFGKGYDAYLNRQQLRGDAGDVMTEEEFNQMRQQEQLSKVLRPNMPMEAKIGAAAQFLPAVTAMFTKQKDPEEFTFTPGVTSPIVTGQVKGLRYEAPTQDEARANLMNEYLAQQRFLDTSGAGAATLSNRQSLFAKKLFADAKLGAIEAKDQLKAEAMTKQSQQKADLVNVTNELKASLANAQLAQKEAQRKDAVDNANIRQRNQREQEKILNRLSIASNLAQGIAGVTGDTLQYKADERVARATGAYGIYERDRVKNMLQGQINPETGKIYTDEEINKKVLEILST
jgi:uncharacterized short protein YbdD (DUF466 family)